MGTLDQAGLGIAVVLLGAAFLVFTVVLVRRVAPRILSLARSSAQPSSPWMSAGQAQTSLEQDPGAAPIENAILLVQQGGKIVYINQVAREWFGLLEEEPDLERLARFTRPSELFIGLCAAGGQARFSLHGRFVDGESVSIPWNTAGGSFTAPDTHTPVIVSAVLVSMRRPQDIAAVHGMPARDQGSMISSIVAELSRSFTTSQDLNTSIQIILETVERLIASDFLQVTLRDEASQQFIAYRFVGLPGVDRRVVKFPEQTPAERSITETLTVQRAPILIGDADSKLPAQAPGSELPFDESYYPYPSFLGVPLITAGEVIGSLELASFSKNALTQSDLDILTALSTNAALALNNTRAITVIAHYQDQQRRLEDISGMVQLEYARPDLQSEAQLEITRGEAGTGQRQTEDDSQVKGSPFSRLVTSIQPLMEVESLGFWLWDEVHHSLDAQQPFIGFSAHFTNLYHIDYPPDSPARALLPARDEAGLPKIILATDATQDERLITLGLDLRAQATGTHNTALIPLVNSGRFLGYLQVSDKQDGSLFTPEDLRLLTIIASQAAAVVDNVNERTLLEIARKEAAAHAHRAGVLQRITALTRSAVALDVILASSLDEVARLLQADTAAIFLDESLVSHSDRSVLRTAMWGEAGSLIGDRTELRLHRPSLFGASPATADHLARLTLPGLDEAGGAGSQALPLPTDTGFPLAYRPVMDALAEPNSEPVCCILRAPLTMTRSDAVRANLGLRLGREYAIGLILVISRAKTADENRPGTGTSDDLAFLDTASGQITGAIERAIGSAALSSLSEDSPTEVGRLRRQVDQLSTLAHLGQELNATFDLELILQRVYDELLHAIAADCGSLLLFERQTWNAPDPTGFRAAQAADVQPVILHIGDSHDEELTPLECAVLDRGEASIWNASDGRLIYAQQRNGAPEAEAEGNLAPQDGADTHRDIFQPPHPGVRASLLVPIMVLEGGARGKTAVGLIHLHSLEPSHSASLQDVSRTEFGAADLEIAQALAAQAAIALANARRYAEQVQRGEILNRRLESLANLFKTTRLLRLEQPVEQSLHAIAAAIQESTPFDRVLISMVNPQDERLELIAHTSSGQAPPVEQSWTDVSRWFTSPFRLSSRTGWMEPGSLRSTGSSYYVPHTGQPPQANAPASSSKGLSIPWQPGDRLLLPLLDPSERPLGLIQVDEPRNSLSMPREPQVPSESGDHGATGPNAPATMSLETLAGTAALENVEIFASQAVLAIQSHIAFQSLQLEIAEGEHELARARLAAETVQSHLPILLRKDLEQTLAIDHLSQRARWIQAGLEIAARMASEDPADPAGISQNRVSIFQVLSQELLARLGLDLVLIASPSQAGPRLELTTGSLPPGTNPEALLGQRNPLRMLLAVRPPPDSALADSGAGVGFSAGDLQVAFTAANLESSPPVQTQPDSILRPEPTGSFQRNPPDSTAWGDSPLLQALGARAFICFAIPDLAAAVQTTGSPGYRSGNSDLVEPVAAVLAISRAPLPAFVVDPKGDKNPPPAWEEQGADIALPENDLRSVYGVRPLFSILARHVAIALQRVRLLEETTRRMGEVQTLLDFTRQLGSLETTSILQTLIDSTLRLVPAAQAGMVALIQRESPVHSEPGALPESGSSRYPLNPAEVAKTTLVPEAAKGYTDNRRMLQIRYSSDTLPGQALRQGRPINVPEVDFARHYPLSPQDLARYRDANGGRLPVSALIVPIGGKPLPSALSPRPEEEVTGQAADLLRPHPDRNPLDSATSFGPPLGVLILENFRTPAAFTPEDAALIASLAQQTALTLENAHAKAAAEAARAEAEKQRSAAEALYQAAESRAVQLQALTDVAATITSSLHTNELIASLLEGAEAVIPYDTATLWLRHLGPTQLRAEIQQTWPAGGQEATGALAGTNRIPPGPPQTAGTERGDPYRGQADAGARAQAEVGSRAQMDVDRLTVRAARGFEDADGYSAEQRIGLSVIASESRLLQEMIATGRPILIHDIRQDARFPSLLEPRYLSWLGVPLLSKGEVVGVIALEKTETNFYTPDHLQAVITFAGQASVALENARLYEESLARAAELDRRSQRLGLLNRLSSELGSSLDATYILDLTLQELLLAINASGGSALMFDAAGEILLQAENPKTTPDDLPIALLSQEELQSPSIFDHLRETQGIFSLQDIYDSQGRFVSPLLAPLEAYLARRAARALLVLPLATGNDLHGLLFIHNSQPVQFTPEEVELARTISNQAAIAAQNASLFQETGWLFAETRQRSAELATLFDLGVNIAQVLDRQKLIDITFENIQHLMQVDSVGLVMEAEQDQAGFGSGKPVVRTDIGIDGSGDGSPLNPLDSTLIAQALENGVRIGPLAIPRHGETYSEWVLASGQPLLIGDAERDQETLPGPGYTVGESARSWLGVPLMVRGSVTGVLAAQSAEPDHFTESHLRLLGQIGNQLAVALDNARLFATVQNYAADLEARVAERTAQLNREHQRTQTLLGIITELSTSLDMDIVLNRTLALINETVGAEHSMIMLVLPDEPTLFLRATLGYPTPGPKGGQPTSLRPDEGLAGWAIANRQPALISDLWEDPRWDASLHALRSEAATLPGTLPESAGAHRSAIAVPLMMGEETLGALLLFHDLPGRFSPSQLDLVQATAKQIAVAINNAQLYTLIRDQAERLGDMLRRQHVETSRSQAILEAVADGVLVTDANRVITLFNASAERILGLERQAVIGQTLEHFLGLFGKAGQAWMDTIRRWSEDPSSLGEPVVRMATDSDLTHTEQIELEDMRVVSVLLSPVRLRNDFLGTVSTFRDVTHQVVVDRLKSEFVATVSHELRTPMTSIKGYVEILLMGAAGQLSPQQTRFLEIVRTNTERLAVLVNDLLDISRIEAGRVVLSLQPLDMRQLAREALADLEQRNEKDEKGMQIHLLLPAESGPERASFPRVLGDAERVHQILDNLLDNAYSYTPAGGRIHVRLSHVNGEIQIEVQDNGIGIHPEDQPRIFERFYRGEDPLVLATSGTGLGLSIVRHLVEMHHGRIWLKSSGIAGEGSTFTFTLPVFEAENED